MGSDKLKGSAPRLLEIPGYHIHPEYDLHFLRQLLHHKNKKKGFSLMLAPMVDMMSILVIYLITNFSATGEAFFVNRDDKLPKATKGRTMETQPIVTVKKEKVIFDVLAKDGSGASFSEDVNDGNSPKLRERLGEIKKLELQIQDLQSRTPAQAGVQVNLVADENLDMESVKKVMRVLMEEGWNTINFVIEPTVGSN